MAKADSAEETASSMRQASSSGPLSSIIAKAEAGESLATLTSILNGAEPELIAPEEVCTVLYSFLLHIRKRLDSTEQQHLWPFANRLIQSDTGQAESIERTCRIADWAIREVAPRALQETGYSAEATELFELEAFADLRTARLVCGAIEVVGGSIQARAPGTAAATKTVNAARETARCASYICFRKPRETASDFERLFPHWAAGVCYAALNTVRRAESAGVSRHSLLEMQLSLLDQLCPDLQLIGRLT